MPDMNLIMENWRHYKRELLVEQEEGPETVGQLLNVIDAHSLALSEPVKKAFLLLAQTLSDVAGFADATETSADAVTDVAEYVASIIESALDKGVVSREFASALANIPWGALTTFLKQPAVIKYLTAKIGKDALKTVVDALIPLGKVTFGAIRGAIAIFKTTKRAKEIFDTAKDPEVAFATIMKDVMGAEDNKATTAGFLSKFNIDDEWQKMLDDKIDAAYIQDSVNVLKSADPNTRLADIDFNARLIDWLKNKFDGRHLGGSPIAQPGAA